jgi:predicted TIM-barrel fold metal-dependent hydrolase
VPVVDIHGHLSPRVIGFTLKVMKENGLGMMVNLSGGSTERSFRVMQQVYQVTEGKILSFYNPSYADIDAPDWGVREAENLKLAVEQYGYRGLKISKALGLAVRLEGGVLLPVDDPALDPLWEMAGILGVPVAIHTGDPRAFWLPIDTENERYGELSLHPSWSYYERHRSGEVPSWEALLAATEEVVRRHPETDFIGVHFGNAPERLDLVERWLSSYPNFYVDIAARIGEVGRHPAKKVRALFLRFQDRILFGTDMGITPYGLMLGAPGPDPATPADIKPFFDLHWRWLETGGSPMPHPVPIQGDWPVHGINLPDKVLAKVYRDNALRLLGVEERN